MHRNLEFWHKTRTFVIVRGGHSPQSQSKPPTMEKIKIKAEDYLFGDSRKGKQWAKLIDSIDITQSNGYAFKGDFLPKNGQMEINTGQIVLSVGYVGSWKNGCLEAKIYKVSQDGLELMKEFDDYRNEVLDIRDYVRQQIDKPVDPFEGVSDETLMQYVEEARKRGLI